MKGPVPRIGRILDGLGLSVFLIGAGIYAWTWWALRRRGGQPLQPADGRWGWVAVREVEGLDRLSDIGFGLMVAGAVLAVVAAVVARVVAGGRGDAE